MQRAAGVQPEGLEPLGDAGRRLRALLIALLAAGLAPGKLPVGQLVTLTTQMVQAVWRTRRAIRAPSPEITHLAVRAANVCALTAAANSAANGAVYVPGTETPKAPEGAATEASAAINFLVDLLTGEDDDDGTWET